MQPHEYSIIGHDRAMVGRRLWIVATLVASTGVLLLTSVKGLLEQFGVPPALSNVVAFPVSAAGIYSAGYFVFNKWVWKWAWMFRLLGVPNISGKWSCDGETVGGESGVPTQWHGELTIHQTWDKIRIYLETETSISRSVSASLLHEPDRGHILMYSYRNEPKVTKENMAPHTGYCELQMDDHLTKAAGDYFNNKGRVTWGRMKVTKKKGGVA